MLNSMRESCGRRQMYKPGQLLRFDPFFFKNGAKPKPKYFLVLAIQESYLLLASLPTSQDHVPSSLEHLSGCINDDAGCFNAYVFNAGAPVSIGKSGETFAFSKRTYIYGEQLDTYLISAIEAMASRADVMVEDKGVLLPDIMTDLVSCLKHSSRVKRGYKALM